MKDNKDRNQQQQAPLRKDRPEDLKRKQDDTFRKDDALKTTQKPLKKDEWSKHIDKGK